MSYVRGRRYDISMFSCLHSNTRIYIWSNNVKIVHATCIIFYLEYLIFFILKNDTIYQIEYSILLNIFKFIYFLIRWHYFYLFFNTTITIDNIQNPIRYM